MFRLSINLKARTKPKRKEIDVHASIFENPIDPNIDQHTVHFAETQTHQYAKNILMSLDIYNISSQFREFCKFIRIGRYFLKSGQYF